MTRGIQQIWTDPVWSKVIAGVILAAMAAMAAAFAKWRTQVFAAMARWRALKASAQNTGVPQSEADMPIADAINYSVNDSSGELTQAGEHVGKGRLGKWPGIGHLSATTKIAEQAIAQRLQIWGRKERGDWSAPLVVDTFTRRI